MRVRHLRCHGSGARQNWCGLAAVDTLGADLSVEAEAVIQACRRVLAERARSCCKARTELTTESAVDTAQVRYRGRTRHQRRRNFATYDSSQRDWLVREGREDEAGAGWQIKHNRNAGSPYVARALILPAHLWWKNQCSSSTQAS